MESMQIFRKNNKKTYNFDVFLNCISAWGLSRKIFYNFYYEKNIHCLWYKLNKKILPSYFGGRNECFYIGRVNDDLLKLDINWSYPAQMVKQKIPSLYIGTKKNISYNKNLFGFVKVFIKSKFNNKWKIIPTVGIHVNNKLIFPVIEEYKKVVIFSEELHYIISNNYYELKENKIKTFYEFEGTYCFKEFINDIYNKRLQAKKDENLAYDNMLKTIMNSSYGCFGIKNESTNSILGSNKNLLYYLLQGTLKNFEYLEWTDQEKNVFLEFTKLTNFKFQNLAVASSITSYARLYLHETMQKIRDLGYIVYYCDTDSIFTNITKNILLNNTDIKIDSVTLGAWKIENEIKKNNCEIYGLKMYWYKEDNNKILYKNKYNYSVEEIKINDDENNKKFILDFKKEIKNINKEDIEFNNDYEKEIINKNKYSLTLKGHKNIKK